MILRAVSFWQNFWQLFFFFFTSSKEFLQEKIFFKQLHLADSEFLFNFYYQGGMKSTVSGVFEDLKFKITEGCDQNLCFPDSAQLAETANWVESGKHQFGSEPSEILNLRSSTTPETVAFMPP